MTTSPFLERSRSFWRIAQGFPADKEGVYPEHTRAHCFDAHPGARVLEYGCGGGSDTLSWMRRGCRVSALDIVPDNVVATRAAATKLREARPDLPEADVAELAHSDSIPFDAETFDVVSSHGVVHHIEPEVAAKVVGEFYRVLKPGGWCYIMLYTEALAAKFADRMAQLQLEEGISAAEAFGWCTDGKGCPHADAYTPASGRALLEGAGFMVIDAVDYNNGDFRTFWGFKPPPSPGPPNWALLPALSDKLVDWTTLAEAGGQALILNRDVLDVGPWYGLEAFWFGRRARRWVSLDADPKIVEWVGKVAPWVEAVQGKAEALPYPDRSFDLVLDFGTFDNAGDPLACYREARRVLRPGGKLLTSFANLLLVEPSATEWPSDPGALLRTLEAFGFVIERRGNWHQHRAVLVARVPEDEEEAETPPEKPA